MKTSTKRRGAVAATAFAAATLTTLLGPAPAEAYEDESYWDVQLRTRPDCLTVQSWDSYNVDRIGGQCVVDDEADGTYFDDDAGGLAYKIEVMDSRNDMVAKAEFHPQGEHLYLYDTKNDGDTVYFQVYNATTGWKRLYSVEGTSNRIDLRHENLSFDEGDKIEISTYDNAAYGGLTGLIRNLHGIA